MMITSSHPGSGTVEQEEIAKLKQENAALQAQVEQAKRDLTAAETRNGKGVFADKRSSHY